MTSQHDVLVVIPAYNEAANIARVIGDIRGLYPETDVLVVNDGSRDQTAAIAAAAGARVITMPYNVGYGAALQTGYKYAARAGYQFVVQIDGDGQHDPRDIERLLATLQQGGWDIVIGSRFLAVGSFDVGLAKKIGIRLFRALIRLFTGQQITDPTSGLQALRRGAFAFYAEIGNFPEDFPDADTLIFMLKKGYRITEIPALMYQRATGAGMHSGIKSVIYTIKMFISIAVVVIQTRNGGRRPSNGASL